MRFLTVATVILAGTDDGPERRIHPPTPRCAQVTVTASDAV